MKRIQIGGAGGAPSNNFIKSLRANKDESYYLIGTTATPSDLFLADTEEKHVLPYATAPGYRGRLFEVLKSSKPDFLHAQHDFEVRAVSRLRDEIEGAGVKLFLPAVETVENCVDKLKSYTIWRRAGVRVPETMLIESEADLKTAFSKFGPKVWIRAIEGGGGTGALPTENYEFAKLWIDRFQGWGSFTAGVCLAAKTITWLSIWFEGELVVAQTRRRRSWNFGNRTLSGVTGITGVAETCSLPDVDALSIEAVRAVGARPHGVYGVDMTYGHDGLPNVTEINIGRFFTTHYFFTKAGLNMPEIYTKLAFTGEPPTLAKKINPLPDGLVWIRGMDVEPVLTTARELDSLERQV
jgi:hypothetical protein